MTKKLRLQNLVKELFWPGSFFPGFSISDSKTVPRGALCRSQRELSHEYFVAKFGFDAAEHEPCIVCPLSVSPDRPQVFSWIRAARSLAVQFAEVYEVGGDVTGGPSFRERILPSFRECPRTQRSIWVIFLPLKFTSRYSDHYSVDRVS